MNPATPDKTVALVEAAQRGGRAGREAFTELVIGHQQWLVRYLVYLVRNQANAEDVAQESFARAHQALSSLSDRSRFKPWLRQIATRLAYNYQRDRKTRAGYEDQVTVIERSGLAARAEARESLERCLGNLSYPYREVLLLFYVEELSVKEIADVLQLGVSGAKMRLSRARTEFKAMYERTTKG